MTIIALTIQIGHSACAIWGGTGQESLVLRGAGLVTGPTCGGRASCGRGGWRRIGRGWLVEAEQQAVPGLVACVFGLVGEVAEGGGELLGVLGSQPERAQHQERLGLGGGDLRSERAECHLGGSGVVVCQAAGGALVVLLRSAAHLAGACGPDQACRGENLQMVGNVALVAAQCGGELADGRLAALAEGEKQPVTHRMAQRLELLRRGNPGDIVLLHGEKR
jgi:hypothetical protein